MLANEIVERYIEALLEVPAVESAVRDVCAENPGKNVPNDIIVISADANARPSSALELREIFGHIIVGELA